MSDSIFLKVCSRSRFVGFYWSVGKVKLEVEVNLKILNILFLAGSRLTNFVGIISQGLRIAPPEAPATGYMVISLFLSLCILIFIFTCTCDILTYFSARLTFFILLCSLAKGFTLLTLSVRVLSIALLIRKILLA